jgi:hypothetical protein
MSSKTIFEKISTSGITNSAWSLSNSKDSMIQKKIEENGLPFTEFVDLLITGVKTGANAVFTFEPIKCDGNSYLLESEGGESVELDSNLLRPYWKAESLKRYHQLPAHRLILYPYKFEGGETRLISESELDKSYSKTWAYLNKHKSSLEGRQKGKLRGPAWYGLSFASDLRMFSASKIVTPTLAPCNSFSIDLGGHLFPQGAGGGCGLVLKQDVSVNYLLGVINSRLLTFYFQRISSCFQGGWFAYEPRYLKRIPLRKIDSLNSEDVARHDRMVSLVERMLDLHKQLAATKGEHERTMLQRQIEATDQQIDALVYELYGLTEEEIRIVEETAK